MHKAGLGHTREEIVKQVISKEKSVHNYSSYVPIKGAVKKLTCWSKNGADILYLTSRKKPDEIQQIRSVLRKQGFPDGNLLFRQNNEQYADVAEKIMPDILIEDNCESIGGKKEMTITNITPALRKKIKSIVVKEFNGISNLPNNLSELR